MREEREGVVDADRVKLAVHDHLTRAGWAVTFEVALRPQTDRGARVIDLLATRSARAPGMGPLQWLAVEAKVSRSDFAADVATPAKQAGWRAFAHQHAYAVPAGLVRPEDVPAGSGLLEVDGPVVRWAVRAPVTATDEPAPMWLLRALAYREATAQARLRRAGYRA